MKQYTYTWECAEWNNLDSSCKRLQEEGFEIFAICQESDSSPYIRIVYREEQTVPQEVEPTGGCHHSKRWGCCTGSRRGHILQP